MNTTTTQNWTIKSSYYGHNVPNLYALYRLKRRNANKDGKQTNSIIDQMIKGLYELIYNTNALAF
jgi:hypothetical protein